jgi:hypothetical protein
MTVPHISDLLAHVRAVLPTNHGLHHYGWPFRAVLVATEPVPALAIKAWDVVLVAGRRDVGAARLGSIRGRRSVLAEESVPALLKHMGALRLVLLFGASPLPGGNEMSGLAAALRRVHALSRRPESLVHVVRPWRTTAQPIDAPSDDAALFELLASVGCTLPRKEQRA